MRGQKILAKLLAIIMIVSSFNFVAFGQTITASAGDLVKLNKKSNVTWTAKTRDGESIDQDSYSDKIRIIIVYNINTAGGGCGFCHSTMRQLAKNTELLNNNNVKVITIGLNGNRGATEADLNTYLNYIGLENTNNKIVYAYADAPYNNIFGNYTTDAEIKEPENGYFTYALNVVLQGDTMKYLWWGGYRQDHYATVAKTLQTTQTPKTQITDAMVKINNQQSTYTGQAIAPTVTVTNNGTTLKAGTDYKAVYSNNVNAGQGKVTVTGQGNYQGTVNKTFTINSKALADSMVAVTPAESFYNGQAATPTVRVTDGNTVLNRDVDYTLEFLNNSKAGDATARVIGKGNYQGTINKTFKIKQKALTDAMVTITPTEATYEGKAINPTVSVSDNGVALKVGTDYTVEITNNNAVGNGSVKVVGKGNYQGTITKTFKINKAIVALTDAMVTITPTEATYEGKAINPTVKVTNNGVDLKKDTDYTVEITNNNAVGNGSVKVVGKGNYQGTVTKTFKINEKVTAKPVETTSKVTLTNAMVTVDNGVYTGSEIKPTVKVVYNGKNLILDTDYTLKFSENINAGTGAKVEVVGKGNYQGTVTKTFSITQKALAEAMVTITPTEAIYEGKAINPTVKVTNNGVDLKKNTDYTVEITNNNAVGNGNVKVVGKGNYQGTINKTFKINQAIVTITDTMVAVTPQELEFDGQPVTPTVKVTSNNAVLNRDVDYTLEYSNNNKVGTATVKVVGKGSFKGEVTKTFTIKQATVKLTDSMVTITPTEVTYEGKAIEPTVKVINSNTELKKDTDYKVEVTNNNKVGQATVKVTGLGSFTGTIEKTFTIKAKQTSTPSSPSTPSSSSSSSTPSTPAGEDCEDGACVVTVPTKDDKKDTTPSTGGSSSGSTSSGSSTTSSSDSSSSTGTKKETVTNADGSKTVKTTETNGTVKEETTMKNGDTKTVETKKDGTTTTTEKIVGGSEITEVKKSDNSVTTKEKTKEGTVINTSTTSDNKTTAKVTLPSGTTEAKVNVPANLGDEDGKVSVKVVTNGESKTVSADYSDGNVSLTVNGNATIEIMDEVVPLATKSIISFIDVKSGFWAEKSIVRTAEKGLFSGTPDGRFLPKNNTTRAQIWVVLARLSGKQPTSLKEGRQMAMDINLTDGTNPNNDVTREQFVSMLWRAEGEPKSSYDLSSYSDFSSVSGYAKEAMAWAVENGIVSGTTATTLSPKALANRAQTASIIDRLTENK